MSLLSGVAAAVTALRCSRRRSRLCCSTRLLAATASPLAGLSKQAPSVLPVRDFLALDAGPVVDIRSPCEFASGHISGSVNLPLFTDEQRAAVGTSYKQQGRQPAVLLGLEAVGPRLASLAREALALAAACPGKPLRLTCARGGMRSSSVAWLLGTVGVSVVLLEGGYKAYRGWCAAQFASPAPRLLLLSGLTGCGKTAALAALAAAGEAVVDLEALACHRGSSFGSLASGGAEACGLLPQPRPEQFENDLAAALAAAAERVGPSGALWLEDEAPNVGRCFIPPALYARMRCAPLLLMEVSTEERVAQLLADYARSSAEALCEAAERLRARLGGERCSEAQALIVSGDRGAAARIFLGYYDRTYLHSFAKKGKPALRLSFSRGASPAQAAAALSAAASALDGELYDACGAVGRAEADARQCKVEDRKANAALRSEDAQAARAEEGRGRRDGLQTQLLERRLRAFQAAVVRARAALAAEAGLGATLEHQVELCLPLGAAGDLSRAREE